MSNKSKGSKFEEDMAQWFSEQGYWSHVFAGANHTGSQPSDVIKSKKNISALVDCKTLESETGRFPLDRIEQNQRLAYRKWKECGNDEYDLAILWNNDVYIIKMDCIDFSKKSIDLKEYVPEVEGFYGNND